MKRNISKIRLNVTDHLWNLTTHLDVLKFDEFQISAKKYLEDFEHAILKAMTKDGWDGEEDDEIVQWSSTGALFYSIVVITTIGEVRIFRLTRRHLFLTFSITIHPTPP